ncbi:MAG: XRE family transcriptional regulator [Nitrospirae bacterium]|nr:MAG: XRE family transcriptional regulator [Nitrospirota bacterium]
MDCAKLSDATAKEKALTHALTYESISPVIRLRAIRAQRGFSLRALKKASGVSVATLVRLEASAFDPRLSTLKKLAKALRVSVCTLIGESKPGKGVK